MNFDKSMFRILILTKRQYTNKDLLDDRFGRLWELPSEIGRKGHAVSVLCLSYQKKKEEKLSTENVSWQSVNAGRTKISGLTRFISRAAGLTRQADVIWACSDSFYGIIGHQLSQKYQVPLVFDLYDNFNFFLAAKLPIVKQLYGLALRECDAVTCVSKPLAHLIKASGRSKPIYVIENAAGNEFSGARDKSECRKRFGLPQQANIVGTAGALHKNRGINHLFDAFRYLKSEQQNLHLALAGPANIAIPEDERIHYLGVLPSNDVPFFYNALDVAVICNSENDFGRYCFPQKTREIMACKVPLISARVGSMQEMMQHNPEWLYKPDSPEDLARVLKDRLYNNSADYGPQPSWSDIADSLIEIFREVSKG